MERKMTPCEKLGYKVGDRFVSQEGNEFTGLRKGALLILKYDDGSDIPWFLCEETGENIPVTLSCVAKQDTNPRIKTGDEITQDGKKYRVTLEEIPQYEFKPGMVCRVDWSESKAVCGMHSDCSRVIYIKNERYGRERVAYSSVDGDIHIGYVNTSSLRPE